MNLGKICLLFCFLSLSIFAKAEEKAVESATTKEQSQSTATSEVAPSVETKSTSESNMESSVKTESVSDSNMGSSIASGKRSWGRIGLSAGLTIPHVIEYGIDYFTPSNMFSSSFVVGGYSFKTDKLNSEISSYDLRGRWHPFMGSFFLGLGYGKQKISVQAQDVVNSLDTIIKLDIKSSYMMPHMGWFSAWDSGFTLGFEFGMIMPSGVSSDLTTDIPAASAAQKAAIEATSDYIKIKKDAESAGDKLGKTSIPYLGLIKLGWVF